MLTRHGTSTLVVVVVVAWAESVKLRTLNKSHGSVHGGDKMHVIGQPFIKGPSLSIIFATPHGDVTALNPEMYSDSVLFFEAPPYPCPAIFSFSLVYRSLAPSRLSRLPAKTVA